MTEHRYQIQVSTQLGMRRGTLTWTEQGSALQGTLTWTEQGSALQGTLHFLHRANPFSGQVCSAGRRVFSGQIQTLVSRISYQADCVLAGSGLTGTFHTASGDYSIVGEAFGPESTLSEETT